MKAADGHLNFSGMGQSFHLVVHLMVAGVFIKLGKKSIS